MLGGCGFILSTALLSMTLDGVSTLTEGDATWRLILAVDYLIVALILLPHYRKTIYVLHRNWFLVALVLLAFASCLWTDTPALAFRRSIAMTGTTLFGISLAVRLSLEEQLRLLSWLFRILAVLSLACVFLLPHYGISWESPAREWRGVFGYKNVLGSFMALSILVEWELPAPTRYSKILNRLAMLLSAVLLYFSNSMTPAVAVAGAILLVEIYKVARWRLRIPLYATILVILLTVSSGAAAFFAGGDTVAGIIGRSTELTGRTNIWGSVLPYILERPILGYGFSGFWGGASAGSSNIDRAMGGTIMYSHNGYIETFLALGLLGFVLTLGFLGIAVKRAYYCSQRRQSSASLWPLAFILFFVMHNFGEATILLQDLQWGICVAVVASADMSLLRVEQREEEMPLVPAEEAA